VLLHSIAESDLSEVQIAISDNASTDETPQLIEEYSSRFPNFDYSRNDKNYGGGFNILRAAELSRAEYCIICGDDDAFLPDAIRRLLVYLKDGPDILLFNRILCDLNLKPILASHYVSLAPTDTLVKFDSERDFVRYFDRCNTVAGAFSFLSSDVFRTELWRKHADFVSKSDPGYYPHIDILLGVLRDGATLRYVDEALVYCRGNNDRGFEGDPAKRILIDLDCFDALATKRLGDYPQAAAALRRLVVREHVERNDIRTLWGWLRRKSYMSHDDWRSVMRRMNELARPKLKYQIYDHVTPVGLLPSGVREAIRSVNRAIKRLVRLER